MINKRSAFAFMVLAAIMSGCAGNADTVVRGIDGAAEFIEQTGEFVEQTSEYSEQTADTNVSESNSEDGEPVPVDYLMLSDTKTVGESELEQISAGMTYGDILNTLGATAAFGHFGYRQYLTSDERLIQLWFSDMDEVCPYSGAELFGNALPLKDENDREYAIVVNGGLVTYFIRDYFTREKSLTSMRLIITDDTKIVSEGGFPANEDALKPGAAVRFETDGLELYSYPPQTFCTKITVLGGASG